MTQPKGPDDVYLATQMAQLREQLRSQLRPGCWSAEDYPAILEAAARAVTDRMVQNRGGEIDSETELEVKLGRIHGKGHVEALLRSLRNGGKR
jgi:hypothetical protein